MAKQRDVLLNFERMRREMDELFSDTWEAEGAPRRKAGFSPRIDLYYCGDPAKAVVEVDLAGVPLSGVSLEISGRELVISGERAVGQTEGRVYQQMEIPTGQFRRVIKLGTDVDSDGARATLEDGILRIELPLRRPDVGTRTVPIERR